MYALQVGAMPIYTVRRAVRGFEKVLLFQVCVTQCIPKVEFD